MAREQGGVVMEPTECSKRVNRSGTSRWSNFQPCGRPLYKDGLCKLHYNVRERQRAKDREYREKREAGEQLEADAKAYSNVLGARVEAHYSTLRDSGYTGRFVVDRATLDRLIALEGAKEVVA